ncbi:transcription regulator [Rhodotorula toruloides]|uniref:Transcription regulator n=1 Tax=Rhodotorula toruloides TaxID=5286 RepID=A0A511KK20_RHOTO|nr:transcription regulator [Rhodotorula toruloides]
MPPPPLDTPYAHNPLRATLGFDIHPLSPSDTSSPATSPPTAFSPRLFPDNSLPTFLSSSTPSSGSTSSAGEMPPPPTQQFGFKADASPSPVPVGRSGMGGPVGAGIDPSVLFGLGTPASGGYGSFGMGIGSYGGTSSVLSDADLDLENMIASFGNGTGGGHGHSGHAVHASWAGDAAVANGLLGLASHAPHNPSFQAFAASPRMHQAPSPAAHTRAAASPTEEREYGSLGGSRQRGSEGFASPPPSRHPPPSAAQSSKRSTSTERTGRVSRSSGVGKAPRQTSRSRSARRSANAAGYQDRPSPGGREGERTTSSGGGTPALTPGGGALPATSSAHGTAAIIIPSSSASLASMTIPTSSVGDHLSRSFGHTHHAYAMSLPTYPSAAGTPSSVPTAGSWFPQAHQHTSFAASGSTGAFASPHVPLNPLSIGSPGATSPRPDPLTGWRPSSGVGMPASAPAGMTSASGSLGVSVSSAGGSRKNKGLEDVLEEEADSRGDPVSEKRRKRRESHNAVERRRRDNINDRISELSALIPPALLLGQSLDPAAALNPDQVPDEGPASPAIGALSLMSPLPGGASGSPPGSGFAAGAGMSAAGQKPNKGVVLAKSVEYIRYLQQVVELQQQQTAELMRQNTLLRQSFSSGTGSSPEDRSSVFAHVPPQPPSFPPSITTTASSATSPGQAAPGHTSMAADSPFAASGSGQGERRSNSGTAFLDYVDEDEQRDEDGDAGGSSRQRGWTPLLDAGGMHVLKSEEDADEMDES